MPTPRVAHFDQQRPDARRRPSSARESRRVPPDGVNSIALPSRLPMTCAIFSRSAVDRRQIRAARSSAQIELLLAQQRLVERAHVVEHVAHRERRR